MFGYVYIYHVVFNMLHVRVAICIYIYVLNIFRCMIQIYMFKCVYLLFVLINNVCYSCMLYVNDFVVYMFTL